MLLSGCWDEFLCAPGIAGSNQDEDTRVYTDSLVKMMRAVQCDRCSTRSPFGCSGCVPSPRGRSNLAVQFEPKGHTVPPSAHPQTTFQSFAEFVADAVPGPAA